MRGRVVHLIGDSKSLFSGVLRSGLAAGVVVTPLGSLSGGLPRLDAFLHVAPLPWWTRRVHRFVLASQDEARALHRAGVALGRLVVVRPGEEVEVETRVEGDTLRFSLRHAGVEVARGVGRLG